MSFGFSIGDGVLLSKLAWRTLQGAKQACGEHDELTREVASLYKVLTRLQKELSNPSSIVKRANEERRNELDEHAAGCERILTVMDSVLQKYNALGDDKKRGKRLWQKIKFGNGETRDLNEIRIKLSAHTAAILMSLNLCSLDSLGRVEATLQRVEALSSNHGEQLKGLRRSLHWATANMTAASAAEGSVWTSYTNDDRSFWRTLRRELVVEGYSSNALQKHRALIKAYVEELGSRGVFDEGETSDSECAHEPEKEAHVLDEKQALSGDVESDASSDVDNTPKPLSKGPDSPEEIQFDGQQDKSAIVEPYCAFDTDKAVHGPASTMTELPHHYQASEDLHKKQDLTTSIITIPEEITTSSLMQQPATAPLVHQDTPILRKLEQNSGSDNSTTQTMTYTSIDEGHLHPSLVQKTESTGGDILLETHTIVEPPDNLQATEIHESKNDDPERHSVVSACLSNSVSEPPCLLEYLDDKPRTIPDSNNSSYDFPVETPITIGDHIHIPLHRATIPRPVQIEEVSDEEFAPYSHANTIHATQSSPEVPTVTTKIHISEEVKPLCTDNEEIVSPPSELRFIFYEETRDFSAYTELEESYQAFFDEEASSSNNSNTNTFITHSPYTPPAILPELIHYHIPAHYFHKFWHPQRVPIYLHGNVFDGLSLANWINGWTAYTFRDSSYQMAKAKRLGIQVSRIGAALSDIERASNEDKARLPKDLYDASGKIWADFEDVLNDIMTEAEDDLEKVKGKKRTMSYDKRKRLVSGWDRLEVQFVRKLCHKMVAGGDYYYKVEGFIRECEKWCKEVRFHEDFVLLWDLWEG